MNFSRESKKIPKLVNEEAFKKYPEPPTDRKSVRYEVLRDNYVVSNNLEASISKVELEKSGSFARVTFINMPTNNFDIGYDGKVLEKTKALALPVASIKLVKSNKSLSKLSIELFVCVL